jgi:hypothetical protein
MCTFFDFSDGLLAYIETYAPITIPLARWGNEWRRWHGGDRQRQRLKFFLMTQLLQGRTPMQC